MNGVVNRIPTNSPPPKHGPFAKWYLLWSFRVEICDPFAPPMACPIGGHGWSASPNLLEPNSDPTGLVPVGEPGSQARKLRIL